MSSTVQRVLLLVGPPGSGKSTFAKALTRDFPEFVRINQDDLGDRQACEAMTLSALQANNRTQSVIIDRCNFDADQRKVWVGLAQQLSVPEIDVIIMDTEFYHCKTRILARSNHPTQVEGANGVDVLHKFLDMMTLPTYFEGFTRIMRVEPQPTTEYSTEAVKEIMERLSQVQRPENLEVPRWQKEDFYFKTQYHRDEEAYRARKAAQYQQHHQQKTGHSNTNNKGLLVDSEGFAIKKRPGQKEEPTAPAPVRPPMFGGAGGGWRAREAAKKQQEPKKFGPTLHEIPKPAIANPFDILGDGNDE
ncbi:hypothetical protein EMPS_00880 [Entomortierella parvispora]|uniref:AAA+ ATPase domain-containing protein n=1 Tax=Entomortierella parvispora TaxID=205924 RepID=A0A9P3H1U3_9FUNG|nr:hypothetical protein EMPS_00880 [Entomortierella parvispora]